MKARILFAAAATAAAVGLAAPALADTPAKPNITANCFLAHDWDSWRGSDPNTIYVRVRQHEFFKLELSAGSNMVTDRSNHLLTNIRGSAWVCSPLDLDMSISDGFVKVPLLVKSITKLTPEQVAAIPEKYRP
jgi:hypothetical protein